MKKYLLTASVLVATATASAAPRVVSSIYPLQQIANAIVGQPTELINDSYLSPHTYAMKPGDAKKIIKADIVLWVGPALMPQLDKYIDRRPKNKVTLSAAALPHIKLLKSDHKHDHHEHGRDKHRHDEHGHDKHGHDDKKHSKKHDKKHRHNEHGKDAHHEEFNYDPHVWLSTHNAGVIAKKLTADLSRLDKPNAAVYRKNLHTFLVDLNKTKSHIRKNFARNPAKDYFVFHNAYAYFEDEFSVQHKGVITMHGGQSPKAGQLNQLKKQLKKTSNACLFREPQFDSRVVERLAKRTNTKLAVLDPVGYQKGKNIGYTKILRNIASQISTCSVK